MKIAVTYDNGNLFSHFGQMEQFRIYEVVDEKVTNTNRSGHGTLVTLLSELKINVLICSEIGAGIQNALSKTGITLCDGVSSSVDAVVSDLFSRTLAYNPNVYCNHHGHCVEDKHGCTGNKSSCHK